MLKKYYRYFMDDPLYQNSIYGMASTFMVAFFGFFFWIIAARLFSPEHVGIATTLISVMTLISNYSLLGFNISLIRYLPTSGERNEKINSVIMLVSLSSIIISIVFLTFLHIFSPQLLFLQKHLLYFFTFILFVIGLTLNTIIDSIFIAYRAVGNILIKNILLSVLKLIFPLFLVFFGSYGIFSSVGLATLISMVFGYGIIAVRYHFRPVLRVNTKIIKQMGRFSLGNYIAYFLNITPTLLLPLLIMNTLGAKVAAYYYVASMILGFLSVIPSTTTNSLLAEGSYNNAELRQHVMKASKIIYFVLIPAIIFIVFFGNFILNAFGKSYADEAFSFLRIVSISSLFMAISFIGNAILKIRHQIQTLIITNIFGVLVILGYVYFFLRYNLTGIGWGWLIGQATLAILYVFIVGRKELAFILFKRIRSR